MSPKGVHKSGKKDKKKRDDDFDWFQASVNGGVLILQGVQQAAQLAPVPFLQQAATATLQIVSTVQAVKDNKEEFERLAEDAASIVFAVWRSYEKSEDKKNWPGPHLDDVIIDLLGTLQSIQDFVEKKAHRNLFKRVLSSSTDVTDIKEYRERLQQAINKFEISSDLQIHETLAQIKLILVDVKENVGQQGQGLRIESKNEDPLNIMLAEKALEERQLKELRKLKAKQKALLKAEREQSRRKDRRSAVETDEEDSDDSEDDEYGFPPPRKPKKNAVPASSPHYPYNTNSSPSMSPYSSFYPPTPPFQPPGTYGNAYFTPYSPPPHPYLGPYYGGHTPPGGPMSVSNVNSGNVTNSVISNVGNDNSVRISHGGKNRKR